MIKKSKTKPVICWIDHGVYSGQTMFIYNKNHDDAIKHLKKIKGTKLWRLCIEDDPVMLSEGQCFCIKREIENTKTKEKRTYFVISFGREFSFDDYDYCVLAHEVLHLCQIFLPDLLKRDNEIEAEAYFHTYIMQKCLQAIRGELK